MVCFDGDVMYELMIDKHQNAIYSRLDTNIRFSWVYAARTVLFGTPCEEMNSLIPRLLILYTTHLRSMHFKMFVISLDGVTD
jgi:hypothetical protein